jgi:tetratricopeptide (TPR) repeat protein
VTAYLAACLVAGAIGSPAARAQDQTVPDAILEQIENVVGLPSEVAPRGLGFSLNSPDGGYREGDFIEFRLVAPEYDGYLYLDYYQIDGNVVHILPGPEGAAMIPRGTQLVVGTPESGVQYEILPPFGRELLVLMASPKPLFDEPRREFEYAPLYLEELREGIERLRQSGEGPLAVLYRAIQTHPRDAVIAAAPDTPDRPKPAPAPAATEAPTVAPAPAESATPAAPVRAAPSGELPAAPVASVEPDPAPTPAPAPLPTPTIEAASDPAIVPAPAQSAAVPAAPLDEEGQLRQRISELNDRMRADPNDMAIVTQLAESYRDQAQLLFDKGDFEKARFSLSMVAALDVTNTEMMAFAEKMRTKMAVREAFDQGLTQLSSGRADLAYQSFQDVLKMDPGNEGARRRLSEIAPEVAEYYHKEALAAARRQNLDLALEIWDKVLSIEPNFEAAKLKRSEALRRKALLEQLPPAK